MNVATTQNEYSTPSEVASACKVTRPTVIAWLNAGIITAEIAVGRVYRFNLDKVKEDLKRNSGKKGGAN